MDSNNKKLGNFIPIKVKNGKLTAPFSGFYNNSSSGLENSSKKADFIVKDSLLNTTEPKTNIVETETLYEIKVNLINVQEQSINILYEDGVLVVSGKEENKTYNNQDYYYKDQSFNTFSKVITIPKNIDKNQLEAFFTKGILTIVAPKIIGSN